MYFEKIRFECYFTFSFKRTCYISKPTTRIMKLLIPIWEVFSLDVIFLDCREWMKKIESFQVCFLRLHMKLFLMNTLQASINIKLIKLHSYHQIWSFTFLPKIGDKWRTIRLSKTAIGEGRSYTTVTTTLSINLSIYFSIGLCSVVSIISQMITKLSKNFRLTGMTVISSKNSYP